MTGTTNKFKIVVKIDKTITHVYQKSHRIQIKILFYLQKEIIYCHRNMIKILEMNQGNWVRF